MIDLKGLEQKLEGKKIDGRDAADVLHEFNQYNGLSSSTNEEKVLSRLDDLARFYMGMAEIVYQELLKKLESSKFEEYLKKSDQIRQLLGYLAENNPLFKIKS